LAIIRLEGLSLFGHHGARPFEKEAGQRIEVDLELETHDDRAERTDRLADAVDYDRLYQTVREVVEGQSFHLLEALAAATANAVLSNFSVRRVKVRLSKQNLGWTSGGCAVIEVTRERSPRISLKKLERSGAGKVRSTARRAAPVRRRGTRKAARRRSA
jgi:7,8-dihydroneopterin aldolase/epimerase/oxygenase